MTIVGLQRVLVVNRILRQTPYNFRVALENMKSDFKFIFNRTTT